MQKNIYIIWLQGWNQNKTPAVVWECARSWIYRNPDWDVHLISDENLKNYVEEEYIEETKNVEPIQARCDLLRYRILYNNPGLYVDATTFCLKPLDSWLNDSMIVDNCFWLTVGQENRKMKFNFGTEVFFDTDFIPCVTFLYSDVENNPVYDSRNFDKKYTENWKHDAHWEEHINFHYSYFRFWQAFVDCTELELRKKIAKNWPYRWTKNNVSWLSAGKDKDVKLPTGVYQIMSPFLMSEKIDRKFLYDLVMKWWPFFKLSVKRTDEIKDWQFIPKENNKKNLLSLEKQYSNDSKIVFLKQALDEEIKKEDGLTR